MYIKYTEVHLPQDEELEHVRLTYLMKALLVIISAWESLTVLPSMLSLSPVTQRFPGSEAQIEEEMSIIIRSKQVPLYYQYSRPHYSEDLGDLDNHLLVISGFLTYQGKTKKYKELEPANYIIIRGFCYIRAPYNDAPLYSNHYPTNIIIRKSQLSWFQCVTHYFYAITMFFHYIWGLSNNPTTITCQEFHFKKRSTSMTNTYYMFISGGGYSDFRVKQKYVKPLEASQTRTHFKRSFC